jgi:hydroxymethylbilane synthase
MTTKILRIATRKSPLALWQAEHVRQMLLVHWPKLNIELLPMLTSGDKFTKDKLLAVGGKGLFVKELEEALLDKRADFAVHSMKDVPAEFPKGLILAAICKRDNPLDAFISLAYNNINALPQAAIVGTSSLRRQSQLLALRPDLIIRPLRGNIQTRLEKLQDGAYQAIILAAAGLERMGIQNPIQEKLDINTMLPACGQGALGIECRVDDIDLQTLLAPLNDPLSALCVHAERQVNALLGGNCHLPVAVFCQLQGMHNLHIQAKVLSEDGKICVSDSQTGIIDNASLIAERCATQLMDKGAKKLLTEGK